MPKPASMVVDAQVVPMSGSEGNKVPLKVFHMEFGIPTVVVAVVQVCPTVIIAAQVVVIMRADLDNVVMQMFDDPLGLRVAVFFKVKLSVLAVSCQGFAVDAQLNVLVS